MSTARVTSALSPLHRSIAKPPREGPTTDGKGGRSARHEEWTGRRSGYAGTMSVCIAHSGEIGVTNGRFFERSFRLAAGGIYLEACSLSPTEAWPAASRAVSTRNGEHDT